MKNKKVEIFCDVNVQIPLSMEVEVEDVENLKQLIRDSINIERLVYKTLKEKFNLVDCVNARVLKHDDQYLDPETNTWEWIQQHFSFNHNGNFPEESPWKDVELKDVVQRGEYVYIKEEVLEEYE